MIPDPRRVPTLRVEEVAQALGLGRSACYEAIKRGEIPSLRYGRRVVVPTARLLTLLGLRDDSAADPLDDEHCVVERSHSHTVTQRKEVRPREQ